MVAEAGKKQGKKQKNGVVLAVIMVVIYVVVLLGTLRYTGVLNTPDASKKAGAENTKIAKKDKKASEKGPDGKSVSTTVKKPEQTTTTTLPATTATTQGFVETTLSEQDKIDRLVKIYEAMDSEQAAKIIAKLTDSEAVAILEIMREDAAAEVLAAMDVQRAANLSKIIGLQGENQ